MRFAFSLAIILLVTPVSAVGQSAGVTADAAQCIASRSQPDLTLRYCDRALAYADELSLDTVVELYIARSGALLFLHRKPESVADLDAALALNPYSDLAQHLRAISEFPDDPAAAEADLKAIVSRGTAEDRIMNRAYLQLCQVEYRRNLAAAADMCENGLKFTSRETPMEGPAGFLELLGFIQYRQRSYQRSIDYLLEMEHPTFLGLYVLSLCFRELANTEKADEYLASAEAAYESGLSASFREQYGSLQEFAKTEYALE